MTPCRFCSQPEARHYLGGGIWVCFRCWLKVMMFVPLLLCTACSADTFIDPSDSALPDAAISDASLDAPSDPDAPSEASGDGGGPDGHAETGVDAGTCTPEIIAGGVMTSNMSGHQGEPAGVVLKALSSTTLMGFTVQNQGSAGTVQLLDDSTSTVLRSLAFPAGAPAYAATVSWALTAGATYDLVIADADNGRDGTFFSYPASDSALSATGPYLSGHLSANLWIAFTDVASCP